LPEAGDELVQDLGSEGQHLALCGSIAEGVSGEERCVLGRQGDRLECRRDLAVLVPDEEDRDTIHAIIYRELVRGIIRDESRRRYLDIIEGMIQQGAQGAIAGCTEIELLVTAQDLSVPYFPTTRLHAIAAVDAALAGNKL
jgi:aspartate racemase